MRFQCASCEKHYTINDDKIPDKGASFRCKGCDNRFTISSTLIFSSTHGNSKIQCSNCGSWLIEKTPKCHNCGLILSKQHEELRIDNTYYERLTIDDKGKVSPEEPLRPRRRLLHPVALASVIFLAAIGVWLIYKDNPRAKQVEKLIPLPAALKSGARSEKTTIVILKSGQTIHADKVEQDGLFYTITSSNGMTISIEKDKILQIATAELEKKAQ